jgi:hypothetical protein
MRFGFFLEGANMPPPLPELGDFFDRAERGPQRRSFGQTAPFHVRVQGPKLILEGASLLRELSGLPLLFLIPDELAVHFFDLRSQVSWKQLNFNACFA